MKGNLRCGDIVQINLEHPRFPGLFVIVTEPKIWGCQGYLLSPVDIGDKVCRYKGLAYIRLKNEDFLEVGKAEWIANSYDENDQDE